MSLGRRRRGGLNPGGGFSPKVIPGLVAWFDASYITGLNDGDSVNAELLDLSGNGYHATQGTAAARPVYKTNIINGRPVVRFDGTDDYFLLTNGGTIFRNKPGATVFGVVLFNSAGLEWWFTVFTPAFDSRLVVDRSSFEYRILDADATQAVTGPLLSNGVFYAVACVLDATNGTGQSFRNGTAGSLHTGGTAGNISNTAGTLPRIGWDSVSALEGDIAAVIAYDRPLASTERARVERYLGSRFAIAVQ